MRPVHDPNYRRLFAFPRMVADLLRAVARGDWLGAVDLDTLERLPAEHVGDSGQQRRGDAVWRVRFHNGWLYLLLLLEFQSSPNVAPGRLCMAHNSSVVRGFSQSLDVVA